MRNDRSLRAGIKTVGLAFLSLSLFATTSSAANIKGTPRGDSIVDIDVDWATQSGTLRVESPRINADSLVTIKVNNFNFLRYTIAYTVEEEVIESYVTLEKLWQQIFSLVDFLPAAVQDLEQPVTCNDLQGCLTDWLVFQTLTQIQLQAVLDEFNKKPSKLNRSTDIACADKTKCLAAIRTKFGTVRVNLLGLQAQAATFLQQQANSPAQVREFQRVQTAHGLLVEKLDALLAAANSAVDGHVRVVGKKRSGRVITVSMTPKDRTHGTEGQPVAVEYFVHSKWPVSFHVGYVYNSLKNVEFEKVRSLPNRDLFTVIRTDESRSEFSAFLSYELRSWQDENYGILATLGTDMASPGDSIYVGVSLRLAKRAFVSGGVVSGTVAEGRNVVLEELGDELQTRELFDGILNKRDWKGFFAITLSPF